MVYNIYIYFHHGKLVKIKHRKYREVNNRVHLYYATKIKTITYISEFEILNEKVYFKVALFIKLFIRKVKPV